MLTKHIVANLIDQLNMKSCIQNSYKNYHAQGLWCIDLFRSDKMNIKLFFLFPDIIKEKDYLVNPHNHGYNFTTEVLYGSVDHVVFKEKPYDPSIIASVGWKKHTYEWYKPRGEQLTEKGKVRLAIESCEKYTAGQGYYCDTDVIHSIITTDEPTCLLLCQFSDQSLKGKDIYIHPSKQSNVSSGYERFSPDEITGLLNMLKEKLEV